MILWRVGPRRRHPLRERVEIVPTGSTKLIPYPAEGVVLSVLHLHPTVAAAAAIDALAVLGDEPLQPHQAGMAEQVGADLAVLEITEEVAVDAPCQQPRQVRLSHGQR